MAGIHYQHENFSSQAEFKQLLKDEEDENTRKDFEGEPQNAFITQWDALRLLTAREDGTNRLVGFAAYHPHESIPKCMVFLLQYVHPEYRKQRIGRELERIITRASIAQGFTQMRANIAGVNARQLKRFRNLGIRPKIILKSPESWYQVSHPLADLLKRLEKRNQKKK